MCYEHLFMDLLKVSMDNKVLRFIMKRTGRPSTLCKTKPENLGNILAARRKAGAKTACPLSINVYMLIRAFKSFQAVPSTGADHQLVWPLKTSQFTGFPGDLLHPRQQEMIPPK